MSHFRVINNFIDHSFFIIIKWFLLQIYEVNTKNVRQFLSFKEVRSWIQGCGVLPTIMFLSLILVIERKHDTND